MSKTTYFVNSTDLSSIEALIDAFGARYSEHEQAIRAMLQLHEQAFTLRLDFVSRPQMMPLEDAFTFDTLTDELVLFDNDPAVLVDAILEMAMYVRGFQTSMSGYDEWKTQFTIGAWRHVRRNIKERHGYESATRWQFPLEQEGVDRFNAQTFEAMLFLAGRPEGEAIFPHGANAQVVEAYQRLYRIMEAVALDISLDDAELFNRRLVRAIGRVEESILPGEPSPFDDMLGPGGFNERFFSFGIDD
ncbi:MAG: hypothetical protein U0528_01165 [Anaerolineae bacterium]|nr:hypothetical protein [Anaerolineae bacterium]